MGTDFPIQSNKTRTFQVCLHVWEKQTHQLFFFLLDPLSLRGCWASVPGSRGGGVEGRGVAPSLRSFWADGSWVRLVFFSYSWGSQSCPTPILVRHVQNVSVCISDGLRVTGASRRPCHRLRWLCRSDFEGHQNHQVARENRLLGSTPEFLISWVWVGIANLRF